jgi:Domain of unknown function (DUF4266)
MSMRIARVFGLLATLGVLAQLCACAPIQPWVKPYERERLADPIMAFDPNPISSQYMEHVFDVRAAARGGNGAAGGGCGCN